MGEKKISGIIRTIAERHGTSSTEVRSELDAALSAKRRGSAKLSARKLYARTELELELDNEDEAEESDDSGQDSMFQELEERSAIAL